MDDEALAKLLEKACPKPSFLVVSNGGPILSLALHSLMIDAGFALKANAGHSVKPDARFLPHKDWNGAYLDQWIFEYTKPGKAQKFILHCSLQAQTKRMFIHCSEELNPSNICTLGLQLDNYVPEPTALRSNKWSGVVRNAPKMYELVHQYIIQPLLANAEDEQGPPAQEEGTSEEASGAAPGEGGIWHGLSRRQQQHLAILAGAVLAVAVAGLVAYRSGWARQARRG